MSEEKSAGQVDFRVRYLSLKEVPWQKDSSLGLSSLSPVQSSSFGASVILERPESIMILHDIARP
jgi:hypothetical protein